MIVLLREETINDLELVLAWRSIPQVYQGLYQQSKEDRILTWEEHWKWWNSQNNYKTFIIQVNDGVWTRDVGLITFRQLDNWCPEVGIKVGEVTLWGKGVGKQALSLALDWLEERGYIKVHTTVLKDNERTKKLFKSVGFEYVGDAREDEVEISLYLKDRRDK